MLRRRFALILALAAGVRAETGHEAWLRYARLEEKVLEQYREAVPAILVVKGESRVIQSARDELIRGLRGMLGHTVHVQDEMPEENTLLVGTIDDLGLRGKPFLLSATIAPEGFWLKTAKRRGAQYTIITAADDRGVLYGAFAYLRKLALGEPLDSLDEKQAPLPPVRWVNQWDNLDGSLERGYGGRSIFWDGGLARSDLLRVSEYGRMLASLGINACAINNVNANPRVLSEGFAKEFARIADAFRPWGVRVAIAIDFGSPKTVGGLDTFDPLDARVAQWWNNAADVLYHAVPDLAGFVMKTDSEGRVGPSAYGRTHADAANVVARALKRHGGSLLYRAFVYDHHMDWRNLKNDRARAAYDIFKPLDGKFEDNVVLQVKNGPIDFQVREPASPLLGALEHTKQAIELQITQEYMGQGRQLVFLVPQWKTTLDFDTRARTPVKALLHGFVGVANIGLDENWTGNQMSQANLYGFGRLAWDPDLSSERIASEWTRLTFGSNKKVLNTINGMLLSSWRTYENYTGPLGLQTLTDITGNHYGVAVESSERNGWGQWHRADHEGVGMDRTVATGTGFIGQYPPDVARVFESLAACPDDLLLFMHHVPYTYVLHSGKTVIQSIYDSHYDGAETAEQYARDWESLRGRIDEQRYYEVLRMLRYQAGAAELWRDAVTSWFWRESGIPDAKGRVGNYPGRTDAESMKLQGYTVIDVQPWETASGGKAVACTAQTCSASFKYGGGAGWYKVNVRYFDQNNGVSHFRLLVGDQVVDDWNADDRLPTSKIGGSSSMRRSISGIALRYGDEIRVEGTPDGGEPAALDYVEIVPDHS